MVPLYERRHRISPNEIPYVLVATEQQLIRLIETGIMTRDAERARGANHRDTTKRCLELEKLNVLKYKRIGGSIIIEPTFSKIILDFRKKTGMNITIKH